MVKDFRKKIDPFRQGLGVSPYQDYIEREVFTEPRQRKFGQILEDEKDVTRIGRFLGDLPVTETLGNIPIGNLAPPKELFQSIGQAISFLTAKPQSPEFKTSQILKDLPPIQAPGVLGLQQEIDDAAKFSKDILKDKLTDTPSLPEGIGVAPPSLETEDPLIDFKTIDKTAPGDIDALQEQREKAAVAAQKDKTQQPAEDLLNNSLSELYGPSDPLTGEERTKLLEQYKQDFYTATGINPSGKPDMKDAMVAFGLALMQNKAGKKLDIGKIFGEVGKAGQTALPLASEARKQAESKKIAAGQFALAELSKEEQKREGARKSKLDLKTSLYIDQIKRDRDFEYKLKEAIALGDDKKVQELQNLKIREFNVAGNKVKIGRATIEVRLPNGQMTTRQIFADPDFDSKEIADVYGKSVAGLNTINDLEQMLLNFKNISDGQVGGTAYNQLKSRVLEFSKTVGLDVKNYDDLFTYDENTGTYTAKTTEIKNLQRRIVSEFKRFLTKETGNGISNVDVAMINELIGDLKTFKDIDNSIDAVRQVKNMFVASVNSTTPFVNMLLDRNQYQLGEEGDRQFANAKKMINTKIDDYFKREPEQDEQGFRVYDLTEGA